MKKIFQKANVGRSAYNFTINLTVIFLNTIIDVGNSEIPIFYIKQNQY